MTVGHGLDISWAQGAINLQSIVGSKPDFVGIRASFGSNGKDDQFDRNRALTGQVPLNVLYHFAYPNSNPGVAGAEREADNFCNVVGRINSGEAADLDWEEAYNGNATQWVEAFWTRVEGRLGIARTSEWMYGSQYTLSALSGDVHDRERQLWLAYYPTGGGDPNNPPGAPTGFDRVVVWQHGSGEWAGNKFVDDDWVYSALGPAVIPASPPTPPPAPPQPPPYVQEDNLMPVTAGRPDGDTDVYTLIQGTCWHAILGANGVIRKPSEALPAGKYAAPIACGWRGSDAFFLGFAADGSVYEQICPPAGPWGPPGRMPS